MWISLRWSALGITSGIIYNNASVDYVNRRTFDNSVIVKSIDDLSDIDPSKSYVLDGAIYAGNTSIVVPEGGLFMGGLNGGRESSYIWSDADDYTMFVTPDGQTSGDVFMQNLSIPRVSGSNSKVFSLTGDGDGSFEFQNVNFGGLGNSDGVASIGDVTDYRQGFFAGCGFYYVDDGIILDGDWSGLVVTDSNVINPDTSMTLFRAGDDLLFSGSVRSDINFISVNDGSVLFDFEESNFLEKGSFSLTNVRTSATDAVPNISGSSSYARFRDCLGVKNTYVGGQWYISSEVETVIAGSGVPVKMAGTTTYADMQWFTNSTDNAFVYDGDQTIEVEVKGNLSFTGTTNNVINIYVRKWDDSESGYVNLSQTAGSTLNSSGRAEGVSFNAIGSLDNNDRVELWIENVSASQNITAELNGYVILSERAS